MSAFVKYRDELVAEFKKIISEIEGIPKFIEQQLHAKTDAAASTVPVPVAPVAESEAQSPAVVGAGQKLVKTSSGYSIGSVDPSIPANPPGVSGTAADHTTNGAALPVGNLPTGTPAMNNAPGVAENPAASAVLPSDADLKAAGAVEPDADQADTSFENAPKEAQTIGAADVGDAGSVLGLPAADSTVALGTVNADQDADTPQAEGVDPSQEDAQQAVAGDVNGGAAEAASTGTGEKPAV